MGIVEDSQLLIGEALDVGLNPARTHRGRGIKGRMSILGIGATGAAVGADLLVEKIRLCQLDSHPTLDASPS